MKATIFFLLFLFSASILLSQNVGQLGKDTLTNYTDINGMKQGHWIKKDLNGNLKYEAYFKNDKPIGLFKKYNVKGRVEAILYYAPDGITASVKFVYSNGKTAITGKYIDKEKDSIWSYYTEDTVLLLQESYVKGKKHGIWRNYYVTKKIMEEREWNLGLENGPWRRYYDDGTLKMETFYKNGKLHGILKSYYSSGKINILGAYKEGLSFGTWQIFNEDGTLSSKIEYDEKGVPKNNEQLLEKENKVLEELDKNGKDVIDPADFMENPDQYNQQMMRNKPRK